MGIRIILSPLIVTVLAMSGCQRQTAPAMATAPTPAAPPAAAKEGPQSVTFRTADEAPAAFDAWTFMWVIPERDGGATLDYVVLEPDGDEYLRYDLTQAAPGQQTRSDFMPGFAGGDPAVFFGKHIEFRVRATKGTLRFRNPETFEFQFFKKKDDGQVDWHAPFARTKAVMNPK